MRPPYFLLLAPARNAPVRTQDRVCRGLAPFTARGAGRAEVLLSLCYLTGSQWITCRRLLTREFEWLSQPHIMAITVQVTPRPRYRLVSDHMPFGSERKKPSAIEAQHLIGPKLYVAPGN
nr:hypothetical protein CFP56_12334 [Quercus suber]